MPAIDAHSGLFFQSSPWFFTAAEVWLRGGRYMSVYRSVAVEDTDELFVDVADMLRSATLVVEDFNDDDDMMFGKARWQLWEL
jgi:hypothetical protein